MSRRTEATDPFGNTFYSEIDVDDGKVREATPTAEPQPRQEIVEIEGGKLSDRHRHHGDARLDRMGPRELAPVVRQWYPKLVAMLPSEGYEAPKRVTITFSDDMQGVAATGGTNIGCAAAWFRQQPRRRSQGGDRPRAGPRGAAVWPGATRRARRRPDARLARRGDGRLHPLVSLRAGDARRRNQRPTAPRRPDTTPVIA